MIVADSRTTIDIDHHSEMSPALHGEPVFVAPATDQNAMAPEVRDIDAPPEALEATAGRRSPAYLQRVFARIDPLELRLVRGVARHGSRPAVLRLALFVNRLGDGWIYPLLALVLVAAAGRRAIIPILAATLSGLLAHAVFPFVKRYVGRQRPFETDATLTVSALPLDKYSCPSGHAMTAAAVFLPCALAFPQLGPGLFAVWCLIGGVRILLVHHYATDLLAGAALGLACGALGSLLLIPN
ncbi:MAG: phosphatase PAP2 family protein [Xanthobacteraceae bacterium]